MALKFQLENLEGLDESLHSHYREDNGKYVLDCEGIKPLADFEKVTNALNSERKLTKEFKDKSATWESRFAGKTPEEIAAQLERIPVLEAESQGKVDAKRLQEITETTVKQRMAPLEHEITKLRQSVVEREQEILNFKTADRRRTIHDAVRAVAAKEGFQESAYSSAEGTLMLLSDRHFTIDSVGNVVVADDSKFLTPGLGVREALVEIKGHHPYLVKQSLGGGAAGSNGVAGGGSTGNPFKGNDMTARGKFITENQKDPQKIEFAWKQAGLPNPWAPYVAK
jgi:hypothetical protein